jgi:hypothetical protein
MLAWLAACGAPPPPAPSREDRAAHAVSAAVRALDAWTTDEAWVDRLDALIALEGIRAVRPDPAVDALAARLRPVLDTGGDPRRRWWDRAARWPPEVDYTWTPVPGKAVSTNFALVEALYCPDHALRPETVAWMCGTLRDDGGRSSGHAAWILDVALDQGCVARADTCQDALRDELVAASLRPVPLDDTVSRDLLAEQILFATLAGAPREALVPAVDRLLAVQEPDGSFGAPGDRSFPAQHATAVGAWGLAEWLGPAPGG